jgi:phytoene dehydrogenase-like protein
LAAAITLARAGRPVLVLEAEETAGGGARSAELTLPGFVHDLCSAIYPLGVGSPFFRSLPAAEHGLAWSFPEAAVAHPFDDGTVVVLERSVEETGKQLGRDAVAYQGLMGPLVAACDALMVELLGPLRPPRHPILFARFGLRAMRSASGLAQGLFKDERARGFFAGLAAHSTLPLEFPFTASFGLVLGILGHAFGWPVARGGAQRITDAMTSYLRTLGGEVRTARRVESVEELAGAQGVLFDVTPRQLLRILGDQFPQGYGRQLEQYRYGPGAFKVDWALDGPIPWKAPACGRAATVHLGATLEEIAASERAAWNGQHTERPYVLVGQQSLVDPTRAPEGKQTAWGYCHVPNASTFDMTERIEAQIERFAPGFHDRVLARSVMTPARFEQHNANLVGGDIAGGACDLRQLFTRPAPRLVPYSTPVRGLYICSSSTPPGGGVHGMCGYHAARAALRGAPRRDR